MEAGHGAEEQVARHARRAGRLQRRLGAGRDVDGAVAAALERARRQEQARAAGAEGGRMVAGSLDVLRRYGWTFLHDVRWPGRPLATIDHVAVGPGGIAVIDAKSWTGTVTVADGTLRQNGHRRERALEGVLAATAAVTALLEPMHRSTTIGMLCLAGQEQEPTPTAAGVPVVGRHQLAEALLQLPVRLSPYEVADIGRALARELGDDRSARAGRAPTGLVSTHPAWGAGRRSAPSGPRADPSPRRSATWGRAASVARSEGAPTGAGRSGGTSVGGTLLRLVLVLAGLVLLVANAGSIGQASRELFRLDGATVQPVPVPAAAVPDPATSPAADPAAADPGTRPAVDPGAVVPAPPPAG